jgi:hypothetical protein
MTTDTSTRLLTEDELELVSGGRIAQKEAINEDPSLQQGGAGFDPFIDPFSIFVSPATVS